LLGLLDRLVLEKYLLINWKKLLICMKANSRLANILEIFLISSQVTFAVGWGGIFNPQLFSQEYTYISLLLTLFFWTCYYFLKGGNNDELR